MGMLGVPWVNPGTAKANSDFGNAAYAGYDPAPGAKPLAAQVQASEARFARAATAGSAATSGNGWHGLIGIGIALAIAVLLWRWITGRP